MEYYYDIYLNYYDYPINYYEWDSEDSIEHFNKLPIIKVDDIKKIILNEAIIKCNYKNVILSDGINSIAIEIVDNKVRYLSSLSYKDENRINEIVLDMVDTKLDIEFLKRRNIPTDLRSISLIKKVLIKKIEELDRYFLKYLYYDITKKECNDVRKMKKYLLDDIKNNFNEKYIKLYDIIYN